MTTLSLNKKQHKIGLKISTPCTASLVEKLPLQPSNLPGILPAFHKIPDNSLTITTNTVHVTAYIIKT
jgi:hypothetical protein